MTEGRARNHDGDLVAVPQLCPTCQPRPSSREVWLAAARLGQRLAAGAPR